MKSKKELFEMLDELKYAELFEVLDSLQLDSEAYLRLKKEFILGKTDIDFNDRLKTLISSNSLKSLKQNSNLLPFSNPKFFFWLLAIAMIIGFAFYIGKSETTGIKGNNNNDNNILISK